MSLLHLLRMIPYPLFEPPHLRLGRWGEKQAELFLRRSGLRILGRRVRVGKKDEIDLLAREGNVLVVIEVKTRREEGLQAPSKAVDKDKKYNLNRAALRYARRLQPQPEAIRFDIVEVIGFPLGPKPVIRHHPSAFGLHPCYRY
jgi:putative endonuclease